MHAAVASVLTAKDKQIEILAVEYDAPNDVSTGLIRLYVHNGTNGVIEQPKAQPVIEEIFDLLAKLEIKLTDAKIKAMHSPEVEKAAIYEGRAALLKEIAERRAYFVSKWQADWVAKNKAAKKALSEKK